MEKSPHFKPDWRALLLIDHQVGTIQLIKNITSDQSIRNAVTLAKAALAFGMPIVMTSSQEDHVQGPSTRRSSARRRTPSPSGFSARGSSMPGTIRTSARRWPTPVASS